MNLRFVLLLAVAVTASAQDSNTVTFHKQVEPILQHNCQSCHRPGQVAPMSFLTYQDVRPWALAMKAAVAAPLVRRSEVRPRGAPKRPCSSSAMSRAGYPSASCFPALLASVSPGAFMLPELADGVVFEFWPEGWYE
jgi:hypothetical protein